MVGSNGRVFASDHQCAVAEIFPDGSFKRLGPRGGAPNGINMDAADRIVIANFGIYDREEGPLERFDPATGRREVLLAEVEGRRLTSANYPAIDRRGTSGAPTSTHAETWPQALDGRTDGFIFVLRPDGSSSIVAEGLKFPNGMALSHGEGVLYCAQTSGADVMAFPVLPGGRLGPGERYGPVLGKLQAPAGEPQPDLATSATPTVWDWTPRATSGSCLPAANKVVAITPSQEVVTVIHDPGGETVNHPTNVTWGGPDLKDLYIARSGPIMC